MAKGALLTLSAIIGLITLAAALFVHPLLVPWLLASLIFTLNYAISLLFLLAINRLKTTAAAGVAVLSFLMRFGLIGLGLLTVALALHDYFLATAICFLVLYTAFLGLEIFVNIKTRTMSATRIEA